ARELGANALECDEPMRARARGLRQEHDRHPAGAKLDAKSIRPERVGDARWPRDARASARSPTRIHRRARLAHGLQPAAANMPGPTAEARLFSCVGKCPRARNRLAASAP